MGVEEKESSSFQGRVSIWNSNGSIVTAPTKLLLVFFLRDPSGIDLSAPKGLNFLCFVLQLRYIFTDMKNTEGLDSRQL